VATHALDVALDDLRKRIEAAEPRRIEAELASLDAKIARALDLAIELGDLDAAKQKLGELRDKREGVSRELASARIDLPAVEDLKPRLREKLRNLESSLKADVALGRLALGGLLSDQRLRVYRDGRIEGAVFLSPETLQAPGRNLEPAGRDVAGARYDLVETFHAVLPWAA